GVHLRGDAHRAGDRGRAGRGGQPQGEGSAAGGLAQARGERGGLPGAAAHALEPLRGALQPPAARPAEHLPLPAREDRRPPPSSPPPPNQPNSFCAPWAKIVAPTPTRTASTATSPARTHPIADPPNRRPYRGGRRPAVPAAPARESTPSSTRFPPVRKPPTCN